LIRLPLKYLPRGEGVCRLPGGEWYGACFRDELPKAARQTLPLLILDGEKRKNESWYLFGALPGPSAEGVIPAEPEDPFATFGILPGNPETLARRYTIRAYTLEVVAWLVLLAGIGLNFFFIRMIFVLLG
jgi:hypothetical protein